MHSGKIEWHKTDLELMRHSAVKLFWQPRILQEAEDALTDLSYEITTIDCTGGWGKFQSHISELLNWVDQFGYAPWNGNLDALNDGLYGYPFPANDRAALILRGFHELVRSDKRSSHIVLDLLEAHSRDFLLFAQRLIVLVQTDDNRFDCEPIGARAALWNSQEWSDQTRGL